MREVFVFGSNLAGIHGAGSARHAVDYHGAIWNQGVGLQGDSYALPTKDEWLDVLPLSAIRKHVNDFLEFARENPGMTFNIVAIGCGLAGYKTEQVAFMFRDVPENCNLPIEFIEVLEEMK